MAVFSGICGTEVRAGAELSLFWQSLPVVFRSLLPRNSELLIFLTEGPTAGEAESEPNGRSAPARLSCPQEDAMPEAVQIYGKDT